MKALSIFLLSLLIGSFAKAESCGRYFSNIQKLEQFTKQLNGKLAFADQLLKFLDLEIPLEQDWGFHYARSVTWREQSRNLQIEVASASSLARSPEKLESAIKAYSKSLELGFDGNSTPGSFGRVAVSIKGTEYHHSLILGNSNKHYASFYLSLGENTVLKRYSISETYLEAEIQHFTKNVDGTRKLVKTEKLQLYKYDGGLMVTILYRNFDGVWKTDLWNRSYSVYVYDNLEWHANPDVTQQTHGL